MTEKEKVYLTKRLASLMIEERLLTKRLNEVKKEISKVENKLKNA